MAVRGDQGAPGEAGEQVVQGEAGERVVQGERAGGSPPSKFPGEGWKTRLWRGVRRTAKFVALGVLVLLLLVVLLVLLLLYSNTALTLAVEQGLGWYNGRIAGEIRIAEVEGRLADDLGLRGVVLVDADANELARIDEVRLLWGFWALLGGEIDVAALMVAGTTVDLRGDSSDLAIPGPLTPSTTIGPSLPLDLRADRVEIIGLDLVGGDGRRLLSAAHLSARDLAWSGTDASLQITQGSGVLPGINLESVRLDASWHSAVLKLAAQVVTDVGRVDVLGAEIDVAEETGDLSITAELRRAIAVERLAPANLRPWLRKLQGSPTLALRGALDGDGAAQLSLRADLPGLVEARLVAGGPLRSAPDLELRGHLTVADNALPKPELVPAGELVVALAGSLRGESLESFGSSLHLLCIGCGEVGGVDLRLKGSRGPAESVDAELKLATLGVDLEGGASLRLPPPKDEAGDDAEAVQVDAGSGRGRGTGTGNGTKSVDDPAAATPAPVELTHARWALKVPSLEHVIAGVDPFAEAFVELPSLVGALASAGTCEGSPLRCRGVLGLDGFAGVGVQVGEVRVDVDAEPLASPLRATLGIAAQAIEVEAAALRLAGVEAEVALGPSDQPGSTLAIDGEIDAWATRRGAGDGAQLAAVVHLGPTLRIALERLELAYRGLGAQLQRPTLVTIADRRYSVDQLDLRLAKGRVRADGAVDRDGSSDLSVTIDDLRLDRLARLAPSLRGRLGGRLSAQAELRGPAQAPTLKASVEGRGVRLGRGRLGDLDLHASLVSGRARANLSLRGDLAERIEAEADAYAGLDLRRGELSARPGAMRVEATIDELRLDRVRPWLAPIDPKGELELGGIVDLKAKLSGSAESPAVVAEVHGRGLRVRGHEVGTLDLKAELPREGDAQLDLRLARRGGVVVVDGQVLPVRLNLVRGGLRWLPRELHQLRVEATRIVLRRQLEGLVDPAAIPLSGVFDLDVSVAGPMAGPMLHALVAELRLRGHRLALRGLELGDVDLRGRVDDDRVIADLDLAGPLAEQLRVHAEAPLHIAPAQGDFRWLPGGEHALEIDGLGVDLSRLKSIAPGLEVGGLVDLDLDATAAGGVPVLEATITAREIAYAGHQLGGLGLDVDFRDRRLSLRGEGKIGQKGAIELRAAAPVRVDLRGPEIAVEDRADGQLSLRVTGIDRELIGAVYELPPQLATYLGFTLTARSGGDGYSAKLAVRGTIAHHDVGAMPIQVDAWVRPTEQGLTLDFGPLRKVGDLHVEVATQADLEALLGGRAEATQIPIQAAVRTEGLGLSMLEPILPDALYDVSGELRAQIQADGTIGRPAIHGELALVDGAVTIVPLQQRLKKIAVAASGDGERIVVDSFSASSGQGSLAGDARVELKEAGYRAAAKVALSRFPLVRPGLPQMQLSALVSAEAKSGAEATEIDVKIARSEVNLLGSTGSGADPIPESDNVHYADGRPREPVAEDISPPEGAAAAENEVVPPEPAEESKRFVFAVGLVDPLEIVGNKLAMRWRGSVRATDEGGVREVVGQLNSKDGFIEFAGNRFTIERGVVTLPEDPGEIAPYLDVTARTQVGGTEITLSVRGRLPKPELILESSPTMSQGAILTLLLTGKEEVGDGEDGQVLAAAASLLAAFQNSELRNYVNQRTGIDQIAVTFEDGATRPVLSLGKRLSDDLYVETAMRINPRRGKNRVEARVEYELAPHWTLETHFGDAAVGGLDVFWEKVFGNRNNPARRKR